MWHCLVPAHCRWEAAAVVLLVGKQPVMMSRVWQLCCVLHLACMQDIISQCWAQTPSSRPSFERVLELLKEAGRSLAP
jgi:hypothetical protein